MRLRSRRWSGSQPTRMCLVWLHDVHGGLVHASFQVESGGVVVRVTGGKTANVALVGAGLAEFGPEISPDAVTRVVPAAQPG